MSLLRLPWRAGLLVALLLLLGGGGAVAAISFLPQAYIVISPETTERSVERDIIISREQTEPDFVRFVLPGTLIDKTAEEVRRVDRSGAGRSEDFARGLVTLINQQDEEQPLLPKTHLRHEASGVFFLTDAAVRIPAQGEATVPVTAKEPGARGEVTPGRFAVDKLPASTQKVVWGESKVPMSGGERVDNPLTEAEISSAKAEVVLRTKERVRGEVTAAAGGAAVREELTQFVAEEEYASAEAGSRAASFEVRARMRARAFLVDDEDLLGLTLLALRAMPGQNESFVSYKPDSFRLEMLQADFERGEAQVRGRLSGLFAQKTTPLAFDARSLVGLSAQEVQERLRQQEGVGDVEVRFSPFWVDAVPARPGAVRMEVKSLK